MEKQFWLSQLKKKILKMTIDKIFKEEFGDLK